jgi:hypothetical protein
MLTYDTNPGLCPGFIYNDLPVKDKLFNSYRTDYIQFYTVHKKMRDNRLK